MQPASPIAATSKAPSSGAEVSAPSTPATTAPARSRRTIGLADLTVDMPPAEIRNVATEPVWLTKEVLDRLWKRMIENLSGDAAMAALLSRVRKSVSSETHFVVVTTDKEALALFEAKKETVLQAMRELTNNQDVTFDILFEEVKKRTDYAPEEKFRLMLEKNAVMLQLRTLFTEVEIG